MIIYEWIFFNFKMSDNRIIFSIKKTMQKKNEDSKYNHSYLKNQNC